MTSLKIKFYGSKANYSKKVKLDLIKTGYSFTDDLKKANLIITACYGQKLDLKTLKSPKFGALNIHPSLLPKYRGAAPVPWTLLNKEDITGATIIKMTDKIDSGPILAQKSTKILPQETSEDLLNRLFNLGTKTLISILTKYIGNNLTPINQPAKSPTPYARKLTKKDGFISWSKFVSLAKKSDFSPINYKINALFPWPGTWTKMPNNKILKLLPNSLVQLEGKSSINLVQFTNGYQHLLK